MHAPGKFCCIPDSMRSSIAAAVALLGCSVASGVRVAVVGAGWGGLGAAHHLSKQPGVEVTLIDGAPRVGGLVRDGYTTPGGRRAEAGQHGFWADYHNIFALVDELGLRRDDVFTQYAEQGQYSPDGLEAVWPVFRDKPALPTGLAQAVHTQFTRLPAADLASAAPLVAALSELDFADEETYRRYDRMTFRDLCEKLGVSRRLYNEAFEPMVLTGLFAPGHKVSAAAALGMAYFFVLSSKDAFDVRWCRGNVGDIIFEPWVRTLASRGVELRPATRVVGIEPAAGPSAGSSAGAGAVRALSLSDGSTLECDHIVLAVSAAALRSIAAASPSLCASGGEWAGFAELKGTDCVATRLWFDTPCTLPYSANPAWGFDDGVGMTFFDLRAIQAPAFDGEPGAVIEVDFYHAATLLALSDENLVERAHAHLRKVIPGLRAASVIDAAVVRLPAAVNWYEPGSYARLPDTRSAAFSNLYYAGDHVRSSHGSWSQEKAYVTGLEAANAVIARVGGAGGGLARVVPLAPDEPHVAAARAAAKLARGVLGPLAPSLAGFL